MTHRRFSIPYIFTVKGIPKRGSKERTGFFFETVDIAIPEPSPDEAPIAAVFPEEFGATTYIGRNRMVELRYHDGKLFNRALVEYGNDHVDVTPEILSRFLDGGVHAHEHSFALSAILPDQPSTLQRGLFPGPDDHHNPIKAFDADQWSSFRSSDRDDKRNRVLSLAAETLIIGGAFWRQVPEPRYMVSNRSDDRGHRNTVIVSVVPPSDRHLRRENGYGLGNWDRMERDILERYGVAPDIRKKASILIEEAFPFDDAFVKFTSAISESIAHDGDMLKTMDATSILSWVSLRDAMANARSAEFTPEHIDAVAEAAEAYSGSPSASQAARASIASALRHLDDTNISAPGPSHGGQRLVR